MLTENISSYKLNIQTNVLGVRLMLIKTKQKFLLYIAVVLISCMVFLTFFLSVNQSAHSEQTYEMTDHEIHQQDNNKSNYKVEDKQNSEQNDNKVFALVN